MITIQFEGAFPVAIHYQDRWAVSTVVAHKLVGVVSQGLEMQVSIEHLGRVWEFTTMECLQYLYSSPNGSVILKESNNINLYEHFKKKNCSLNSWIEKPMVY